MADEEAALGLALGDADEAARLYSAQLARPGADPRLRLNVAAALLQAKRVPEALQALRELEAAAARDPATLASLAELCLRAGEPAAALPHLERLLAAPAR